MNADKEIRTVVFWGAGATAKLRMATTAKQNQVFLALSQKDRKTSYNDCLRGYGEVFGKCLDDVCDLLTLLDDDDLGANEYAVGYRMSGFSKRQRQIMERHANDLGTDDEKRRNRVIMMRLRYDWAAAMRILRLQRHDVTAKGKPAETFTQAIYNLIDANIADGTGIHVFDDRDSAFSNFLDPVRLRYAKSALVMFINLMFAAAWTNVRENKGLDPYIKFGNWLATIRANEARDSIRDDMVDPLFRTSFVSMNFDPLLWWIIKNADAQYNEDPFYIGKDNTPLYLGEDVDQVDAVRAFEARKKTAGTRWSDVADEVLPEQTARFINKRGMRFDERCGARYQTVKIFFPHGSPNLKICPCCGKTTLYQGNELSTSSESLFPPFFFKNLAWGCSPADALRGGIDQYAEKSKWEEGELDNIQCRHCGRSIRMCDTEMVMQSGLNTPPSYLLQRISHNVDNTVMNANHIVLMGYRLPPDDGAVVAELQARTTRENWGKSSVCCSVVGFVPGAQDQWLYPNDLDKFLREMQNGKKESVRSIENARRIFGRENVRANMVGIPDVFGDEATIREMLYPSQWS